MFMDQGHRSKFKVTAGFFCETDLAMRSKSNTNYSVVGATLNVDFSSQYLPELSKK